MTTTTDMNTMIYHTRMNEELSNSFMDTDDTSIATISNGHSSPLHGISNEKDDDVFHQG